MQTGQWSQNKIFLQLFLTVIDQEQLDIQLLLTLT